MSDRGLKVIAGLCGGLAAFSGLFAMLGGWVLSLFNLSVSAAYGTASVGIISGPDGPTQVFATGSSGFVLACVLIAVTALAGALAALIVLKNRRDRRSSL